MGRQQEQGGPMIARVSNATISLHLKIVRTVKFLCSLARGAVVLRSDFIETVLETREVPDANDFILNDEGAEKRYNFKLERSMARAKANRGKLLQGVPVYCTEKIRNGQEPTADIAVQLHR
ncbi:regulator of Ty1 Transposition [Conoideocrella luteorostrata]|uniref:Regulator of Ty1 Transposition n=1 Tax=Conoideocrella luteorostrata TaxID=1105319 RepID=A0AAJ0CEN2_9HYPO|nr:regulator of Ty1 Transposition [Conoideocrella luteorostrata]